MATDTAPRPRRMYWQLPVFAVGVTAAILAWRYFPQAGFADSRSVEQDRYTLRQSIARRPANVAEVQALLAKLGDEATRPGGNVENAFVCGSAFLLLAEQGPADQQADNWRKANALLGECDGAQLADKQDRARLTFRAAKAAAGAGVGDPAALIPQLEVVPPGEEPGEKSRLLAEVCLRKAPPDTKRAKAELSAYLSGPPRGTPEQAARLKLTLADLCASAGEGEKAKAYLREIGDPVPTALQAEAKLRLARLALADRDVNEAVKLFQSAETLPHLPAGTLATVRYEIGRGLILLNNPAAARDYLLKAADSPTAVGAAANVRLMELAARDPDPTGGLAYQEAALKGLRAGEWVNPHVPLPELRQACETLVAACKAAGKHMIAARAAEVYAPVAEGGKDRELWADVMAAWGSTPGNPVDADKLKLAAAEWVKLADLRPDDQKTGLLQKAAAAYQAAGDATAANGVLARLSTGAGVPPDAQAKATIELADAQIAAGKLDEGVKTLGEIANAGGPVGIRATLRLALLYAAEGKRGLATRPADPKDDRQADEARKAQEAGRKQVEYAVTLLTQLSNKTYTTADERTCHQQALYELGKLELNTPAVFNCSDAETRLRRLVREYSTGEYAERGQLFLGIALSQMAQGAGGGAPPADAAAKFAEARKLFEGLSGAKEKWVRTQADIRLAHTLYHMGELGALIEAGPKMADRYSGQVQELIILNFVFTAHTASKRPDLARRTLDRMEKTFADLTDAKYSNEMPELTKGYWVDQLDKLRRRLVEGK